MILHLITVQAFLHERNPDLKALNKEKIAYHMREIQI